MAFAPILASLAAINSSTTLIQGGISAVQSGIGMIGTLFSAVFNKLGQLAVKIFTKIKDFIKDKVIPALEPFIGIAKKVFNGVLNIAKKVIGFIVDGFKKIPEVFGTIKEKLTSAIAGIPELFGTLKDKVIDKLVAVKDFIFDIPSKISEAIGKTFSKIGKFVSGLKSKLAGVGKFIGDQFAKVGDIMLWPFKQVWNIIKKIKDAIAGAVGGLIDKAKGLFGGKKKKESSSTQIGTAVSGGVNQYFTMNINVSGVTDRSDKRQLARELGELMQEETARALGGTTTKSRYA
jgi:phage-related protein|tara:strand:- start:3230 stop:4099 length:870 start_codon:yes stop_codon:yes gene_type:complete